MSSSGSFARTSGARRAGPGEYEFELTKMNPRPGGPGYSSASGACVEGDRIMVGLMRVPAAPAR